MTGLDSPECRAGQHTQCRDDEAVPCLCRCHGRHEFVETFYAIRG
jgi:hypothetical protein